MAQPDRPNFTILGESSSESLPSPSFTCYSGSSDSFLGSRADELGLERAAKGGMISAMDGANKYQKEYELILQGTEERAALRERAAIAERFEQLTMIDDLATTVMTYAAAHVKPITKEEAHKRSAKLLELEHLFQT